MSKAIDDLKHEHEAILSSLATLDVMVDRATKGGQVGPEDVRGFIRFLKEFADTCHHGKEEGILFPTLVQAGMPERGGPIGVMLTEHTEGRRLIKDMEDAAAGTLAAERFARAAQEYAGLLRAHIQKENNVLFPAAERVLSPDELERIHGRFEEHEEKVIGHGRHEELHALLKELKRKYPA